MLRVSVICVSVMFGCSLHSINSPRSTIFSRIRRVSRQTNRALPRVRPKLSSAFFIPCVYRSVAPALSSSRQHVLASIYSFRSMMRGFNRAGPSKLIATRWANTSKD